MQRILHVTLAILVGMGQLAQANSTDGPGSTTTTIDALSVDNFQVTHIGGIPAQVRIKSFGATYLEVVVLDDLGREVAYGTDKSIDQIVLSWLPDRTQKFTVKVINRAPTSNVYFISTN